MSVWRRLLVFGVWTSLWVSALLGAAADSTCDGLKAITLENARVTSAEIVIAGSFRPADLKPDAPEVSLYQKAPEFCRARIEAKPSGDSHIQIEVWLPVANWNHKLRGTGNGGYAGALDYRGLAGAVLGGYAGVATDAGHTGEATDSSWALGHPEKIIDFGYRAIHEMTAAAKVVANAFYGSVPKRAYFDACSDGGREALMEAQRYPEDYDGILAGAPANNWTHMLAAGLQNVQVGTASPANFIEPEKLPLITEAVLAACDANDGVRDGILNDPTRCHFDPASLLCKAGEPDGRCLTAAQVRTVKKIYAGGQSTDGKQFFPGILPSSEAGDNAWKDWVTGPAFEQSSGMKYAVGFFQNMVYSDAQWKFRSADVAEAMKAADQEMAKALNSTDPNLSRFEARGGKLILYHGWIDPAIAPENTIQYYRSVVAAMGQEAVHRFVRLYMVPGMQHCAGGPGPYIFGQLQISRSKDASQNVFTALEHWVEQSSAPGAIVATKLNDDKNPAAGVKMTRPLCPYPQSAQYKGSGSTDEAASFACVEEKRGTTGLAPGSGSSFIAYGPP